MRKSEPLLDGLAYIIAVSPKFSESLTYNGPTRQVDYE